mgnify:CR=1 FL=1|jgi:hypothetical protein
MDTSQSIIREVSAIERKPDLVLYIKKGAKAPFFSYLDE